MKRAALWRLSVRTTPAAEDAVVDFLAEAFGQLPVSYTHFESGETTVSLYLARKPAWGQARRAELGVRLRQILANVLSLSRAQRDRKPLGKRLSPLFSRAKREKDLGISLEKVRQEDWTESWKQHFKPIEIGSSLLIRPSWSRRRGRRGQAAVVLDPGLSFGTGQHPTTAFCLEQLVARRERGQSQSLLDLGTGSGILALAAAKLGYAPIQAIDCDAEAVKIARENARRNRVSHKVRVLQQDVAKLPDRATKKYSLVCANLIAPLLLGERRRIVDQLDGSGILIVAGILKTEFRHLQRAFEGDGLRLIASRSKKEWRSGAFVWDAGTPRIR